MMKFHSLKFQNNKYFRFWRRKAFGLNKFTLPTLDMLKMFLSIEIINLFLFMYTSGKGIL